MEQQQQVVIDAIWRGYVPTGTQGTVAAGAASICLRSPTSAPLRAARLAEPISENATELW